MSDMLQERLGHHAERLGITISFSHEEIPMDTAGPLALARKLLTDGNDGKPFFVMNADVTADFPFKQMLEFHKVRIYKFKDNNNFTLILISVKYSNKWFSLTGKKVQLLSQK